MKRVILAFCLVASVALAANAVEQSKRAVLVTKPGESTQGVFVTGGQSCLSMYAEPGADGVAMCFYANTETEKTPFAIAARKGEAAYFQVTDDKGKAHQIPVTALLKLMEKK